MSSYQTTTDRGEHADQYAEPPHPPMDECSELPAEPTVPARPGPKVCEECPPADCQCLPEPSSTSTCIEELITKQAVEIAAAEKAKAFKATLEALLGKAKAASLEYTHDAYEKLCKRWSEQDRDIAKLLHNLACGLPCWNCVIECHVCKALNDLQNVHHSLYYREKPFDAANLHDLACWYAQERDRKERHFNHIKGVVAAWESPAKTIDKLLTDNAKFIADAGKLVGSEPGKVVSDIVLKLVPSHMAIAPVAGLNWATAGAPWKTNILKEFTDICPCDKGDSDHCCGVDLSAGSLRQMLIGPQPYLVGPNHYFEIICCLVEKRYEPAKNALGKAEAEQAALDEEIKKLKARLDSFPKTFEAAVKGTISGVVDCAKYKPASTESHAS